MLNDSSDTTKRQVIPKQPTAFVRTVIGIKTTRYISIPPALAATLDLRIGDSVYLEQLDEIGIQLHKHTNGPRHA